MQLRLMGVASLACTLACVPRTVAPPSETPTPIVTVEQPRCPQASSENPPLDANGRLHVQSPAPLSCPAIVDPRGELIAACAGRGVAVIDLDSGRELLHVPARTNSWGWDATGGLLVARNGQDFVEIDRLDPRARDPRPEHRATIEITGDQRPTVGLSRHGEVATWLRYPVPDTQLLGLGWQLDGPPSINTLYWRGLDDRAAHELELRAPTEFLWAIDGRAYAHVIDGEQRISDPTSDEVLARWTDHGSPRERRAIVGLGRARMIHEDSNGRFWLSARTANGFERQRVLDQVPRHAWFESFSPHEDVGAFRVSAEQADDELLLVDLATGALLATRSFAQPIHSATVVDPRCGVLVIAAGDPSWWPTEFPDAPTRRLGLPRTAAAPPPPPTDASGPELRFDFHACTATLERDGDAPVTLRWPAAADGSEAKYCTDVLVDPARTRALLMTRDPPDRMFGDFDRPWAPLRASMFALDGQHPERPLWTRTLPDQITAANFVDGELVLASGVLHSTIVRLAIATGRKLGRTQLSEHAAIVAFVQVPDGFVALTNEPYTRFWDSDEARQAGLLNMLGPDRPQRLYLNGFDQHWTRRWTTSISLSSWPATAGWFPVLDRSGTELQVDAQGRYLIFARHDAATLATIDKDGIRWIETPEQFEFTHDRRSLFGQDPAGVLELRALSDARELAWQLATYADGTWIRWREGEVLEHSPGDAWQTALNRVGARP